MQEELFEGEPAVLRVSELAYALRDALRAEFSGVWVEGEISSLHRSSPGHVYFDLIDEEGQLRCALFRRSAMRVPFDLDNGLQVRVRATVDLYPERGSLQLIVDEMRPAGEGALRLAFEQLRRRLVEEGIFDEAHKQPLPFMPARVGLVTSVSGAAIHDFVRALRKRGAGLELVVVDARVQGDSAWREIVRGLRRLDAQPDIEVIVLSRGGGSIEDLWAFNREELVRAIFEAQTPVVSAIGHEVDVVLSDLVADARAATPTAAADLVAPDRAQLDARLEALRVRLVRRQRSLIAFMPPTVGGVFFPDGFIFAIGFAGLLLAITALIIPPLMVRSSRNKFAATSFRCWGGNSLVYFMIAMGVFYAACHILAMMEILPVYGR